MTPNIKIYCDSGADITGLKSFYTKCDFYQYPYDSSHRPKRKFKLALPSEVQWRDGHATWDESTATWEEHCGSNILSVIKSIVGSSNRRDALHLDSAYKTGCKIFLTSDKGDIWQRKKDLEPLCGFKIFYPCLETQELLTYIQSLLLVPNISAVITTLPA